MGRTVLGRGGSAEIGSATVDVDGGAGMRLREVLKADRISLEAWWAAGLAVTEADQAM